MLTNNRQVNIDIGKVKCFHNIYYLLDKYDSEKTDMRISGGVLGFR